MNQNMQVAIYLDLIEGLVEWLIDVLATQELRMANNTHKTAALKLQVINAF